MSKLAWVFPGQGAQFPGMGKELYREYECARAVFEKAGEILKCNMTRLIFEGAKEELTLTHNAQPAILTVSVAAARVLMEHGMRPDMVAGLSLGEYSALVVAGSISFEDAVVLTRNRGKFMQEACPPGRGAMAAILSLSAAEVEAICYESSKYGEVIGANYNCPGQVVISGAKEAVEHAVRKAQERGGKAVLLAVSAPFHCKLMEPAGLKLKRLLEKTLIKRPEIPVYTNVTGRQTANPDQIRKLLVDQVTSPVLWQVDMESMVRDGAEAFIEVGPGKTLTGFAKRLNPKLKVTGFLSPGDLESVLALIKECV